MLGGHQGAHGTDAKTEAEEAVLLKAPGSSELRGKIAFLSLRSNSRAASLCRKLLMYTESWFSELISSVFGEKTPSQGVMQLSSGTSSRISGAVGSSSAPVSRTYKHPRLNGRHTACIREWKALAWKSLS